MSQKIARYGLLFFSIYTSLFLSHFAVAQEYEQVEQRMPVLSDRADFEAFVDGIMAVHLKANHIAGATFAAVQDGQVFLAKGYGYADVEKKKPVAADRTLFRPGSVSKLFTWTAVMQLFEQGKIDLNADVNSYLQDFKIPATFPEPITMTHLLTHTPGFEDQAEGMAVRKPDGLEPLGKWLSEHMPRRVRPPGQLTSYSNYGSALAGYIVEVVSGMPFEKYIEENIFKPLGMSHSTFRQPLPADLAGDMSVGYRFKDGVFAAQEFELLNGMAPAGALSTTAADMAKFMIAHLQNGLYGEARILNEETARLMHTQLFTHDPRLPGNAYGFWQGRYNDLAEIGHGGDTILFHSELLLVPQQNFGLFVSYNSVGGEGGAREELTSAVLDRYFPAPVTAGPKPREDFKKRAGKFAGVYGATRVNASTFEKLGRLVMNLQVKPTGKNTLLISFFSNKSQWVEVEPEVFREVGGQGTAVFTEDTNGNIARLYLSSDPIMAFLKLRWFETPSFHIFLVSVLGLFFLSTFLWPVRALFRRICGNPDEGRPAPRAARWLAFGMSALCLIFIIGTAAMFKNYEEFLFGIPLTMKILLVLPLAAIVLGVGVFVYAALAWIKGYWRGCARVHYTLVFLAFLGFVWFLYYWNFLAYWF
jgi:CubicO group peptidase (beta-lactamase class C family)